MDGQANDNENLNGNLPGAATPACPGCGKPREEKYRPFCSKHCADVDLARWLGGRYAIPARQEEDEDGDAPQEDGGDSGS